MNHYLFNFIIVGFFSLQTMAGPSTGGGGDVVILPNDKVVLADPFLDHGGKQPNNMPPLRPLNPRILQAADAYLRASQDLLLNMSLPNKRSSDIRDQIALLSTRKSELKFYGVQNQAELNNFCAPGGKKSYILAPGMRAESAACTAGTETFIVEPLFIRMSIRQQALLLIHERLTTLRDSQGGKNYSAVARFTTGLDLYLDLYREQYENRFRVLSQKEREIVSEFYIAIEEIELRNSENTPDSFQWLAARIGGGRIHNQALVDDTATVALNFVLLKGSKLGRNSRLLKTGRYTRATFVIENDVVLNNVDLRALQIKVGANTQILDSVLAAVEGGGFVVGQNSVIKDSELQNIQIGDDVNITQSKIISTSIGSNVVVANSEVTSSKVESATKIMAAKINKSQVGPSNMISDSVTHDAQLAANTTLVKAVLSSVKLGESSEIISSKIHAEKQISVGGGSRVKDSTIDVGSNVINLAKLNLENGIVDKASLSTYPEGTPTFGRSFAWESAIDIRSFVGRNYSDVDWGSQSSGFEYKISESPNVQFTGRFYYQVANIERGIFDKDYYHWFRRAQYKFTFQPNGVKLDERPNSWTIDNQGVLRKPGPAKWLKISGAGSLPRNYAELQPESLKRLRIFLEERGTEVETDGFHGPTYINIKIPTTPQ